MEDKEISKKLKKSILEKIETINEDNFEDIVKLIIDEIKKEKQSDSYKSGHNLKSS